MSPNLTAVLLAERAKKLTPIEVPGADFTIYVRELSYEEGRNFSRTFRGLDTTNVEQCKDFMDMVATLIITDPDTFNPIFGAEYTMAKNIPLRFYNNTVNAAVTATGLLDVSVSTKKEGEEKDGDEVAPAVIGSPNAAPLAPTTLPDPSTAYLAATEIATDSSIDSPPNSESLM